LEKIFLEKTAFLHVEGVYVKEAQKNEGLSSRRELLR